MRLEAHARRKTTIDGLPRCHGMFGASGLRAAKTGTPSGALCPESVAGGGSGGG
ncbi:hypothetical protein BZL30_6684 [Mycobacterium kansasii]|uniref:Uncharacterized protein n=1 Tax=Mycobacterium kansasii TaxID=1768 RepID=A0A1V3WV47_MYCKA|nr:hypothetical protein BZL30_6684 [Mycobacterium kansasii]